MQRAAVAICDMVQAGFSHSSVALGQTGGSPSGPRMGVLGLLLWCCLYVSGTTSSAWCCSESSLESGFLPGEGE